MLEGALAFILKVCLQLDNSSLFSRESCQSSYDLGMRIFPPQLAHNHILEYQFGQKEKKERNGEINNAPEVIQEL